MEALEQLALAKLAETKNCAQASFFALDQHFGLGGSTMVKALSPFPGIALRGETCGAVTGAMMALGLVFGAETAEDEAETFAAFTPARELCRRLEEELGSTRCGELLEERVGRPIDFTSPEDLEFYRSSGGFEACAKIVTGAVRIAAEIIQRDRPAPSPESATQAQNR